MTTAIFKLLDGQVIKTKKDTYQQLEEGQQFYKIKDYHDIEYIIPYTSILYVKIEK